MTATDDLIRQIMAREGGYVNHPDDPGGPTKYGVTLRTLGLWRGHPCLAADVQNLTADEAALILTRQFVEAPGLDRIADDGVRAFLVDWGVNSGPATAIKALQNALHQDADGVLGAQTLAAANQVQPTALLNRLIAARMIFVGHIITRTPALAAFAEGWLTRLAGFL